MSDLISRSELRVAALKATKLDDFAFDNWYPCWQMSLCIKNAPAVEAIEVIHAHWIMEPAGMGFSPDYRCSACRKFAREDNRNNAILSPFCPNCGTRMDGTT